MSKVDWSKAPEGAEFYASGNFYWHDKNGHLCFQNDTCIGRLEKSIFAKSDLIKFSDYEPRPTIPLKPTEWPAEDRIDNIGTNGGDGLHYLPPCNGLTGEQLNAPKTSEEYLSACLQVQRERGKQYDASDKGERSFAAAAVAFNAVTGKDLKGSDVCLILEMVKLVRQYSSPDRLHADSVLDKVSYSALWAEELTKELSE